MNKYNLFIKISAVLIILAAITFRIIAFYSNSFNINIDECHSIAWLRDNLKETLTVFKQGANFLIGYKLLLKGIYSVFQFNYTAFKLPSLIAGILCVFLFKSLAFKIFKNKILALSALLLFTFNYTIIYYSNVIKPYEFDILFSLFIIKMFIIIENIGINEFLKKKIKYLYALITALSLFFSIPSVIIFFLCYSILLLKKFIQNDKSSIINLIKAIPVFLILIGIEYFLYISQMIGDESLKGMWLSNEFFFMPNSIEAVNSLINFSFIIFSWVDSNVVFHFNKFLIIGLLFLFFGGTYNFLKKNNFNTGIYICSSIYVFILLSFLKIYPFTNRCITFIIPLFILVLLKAFDTNLNKQLKLMFTSIAVIFCTIYLYFIVFKCPYISDFLKQDKEYFIMQKIHFRDFENLKEDEILFSTSTPCYYCFNNPNVIPLGTLRLSQTEKSIYESIAVKIKNKNKIYFNYNLLDDNIEDINKFQKYFENKGYKLVSRFDKISNFSYLEFKKLN